jgi:hypothetical protein
MDYLELAKTLAVPVACTVCAVCLLVGILFVTVIRPHFTFKIKDWFEFGSVPPKSAPDLSDGSKLADKPSGGPEPAAINPEGGILIASTDADASQAAEAREFFEAKTVTELEAGFEIFKGKQSYSEDEEFWTTWYHQKRCELTKCNIADEMDMLATINKNWVWPLIIKSRRQVIISDQAGAIETLEIAITRSNDKHRSRALSELMSYKLLFENDEAAYELLHSMVSGGASDAECSDLLSEMATHFAVDGDPFSNALLREMAIRYAPANNGLRFSYTYEIGEIEATKLIAYEHYSQIDDASSQRGNALNNMGVILERAGLPAAQYRQYERALKRDNGAAAANIAHALVRSHFLDLAKEIIKDRGDSDANEGLIVAARNAIGDAERDAEKELEKFESFAEKQYTYYTRAVRGAFANWRKTREPVLFGSFAGADEMTAVCDGRVAKCRATVDGTIFDGNLEAKALCYEGVLCEDGKTLLTGATRRAMLTATADGDSYLLIWPANALREKMYSQLGKREARDIKPLAGADRTQALPAPLPQRSS